MFLTVLLRLRTSTPSLAAPALPQLLQQLVWPRLRHGVVVAAVVAAALQPPTVLLHQLVVWLMPGWRHSVSAAAAAAAAAHAHLASPMAHCKLPPAALAVVHHQQQHRAAQLAHSAQLVQRRSSISSSSSRCSHRLLTHHPPRSRLPTMLAAAPPPPSAASSAMPPARCWKLGSRVCAGGWGRCLAVGQVVSEGGGGGVAHYVHGICCVVHYVISDIVSDLLCQICYVPHTTTRHIPRCHTQSATRWCRVYGCTCSRGAAGWLCAPRPAVEGRWACAARVCCTQHAQRRLW